MKIKVHSVFSDPTHPQGDIYLINHDSDQHPTPMSIRSEQPLQRGAEYVVTLPHPAICNRLYNTNHYPLATNILLSQ